MSYTVHRMFYGGQDISNEYPHCMFYYGDLEKIIPEFLSTPGPVVQN